MFYWRQYECIYIWSSCLQTQCFNGDNLTGGNEPCTEAPKNLQEEKNEEADPSIYSGIIA